LVQIGADFCTKKIPWTNDLVVVLKLWDIAGQDHFAKMTRSYYTGASGAIIVFDCQSKDWQKQVLQWKDDVDSKVRWRNSESAIPTVLFINKVPNLLKIKPIMSKQ
jgi:Ras-related protein Rab-32